MRIPNKIQVARVVANKALPYFSAALFRMPVIQTREVEYMSADMSWNLYVNPDAIEEYSPNELAGQMVHLLMHLLRDHGNRCKNHKMNPEKFALAADCEIFDDMRTDHIVMPEHAIFPEDLDLEEGDIAESYYRQIPDQPSKKQQAQQGKACQDGSCANGQEQDYEVEGKGTKKVSEEEAERIRKDTARKIKEEAKKSRGNIPAGLERWADSQLSPQVNWRRELATRIRNAIKRSSGMMDYSYAKPSRRRMANVVLPSMIGYEPTVAVVIDTSGSMSDKELSQAVAETGGILKSCGIREGLDVISVDAEVSGAKKVFSKTQIQLAGGGGTDMRIGIDWVKDNKPETDVCVIISDGWTPWPERKPKSMECIAVITEKSGMKDTPSWMKAIEVKV